MPRWNHLDDDQFAPYVEAICIKYEISIRALQSKMRTPIVVAARKELAINLSNAGMLIPRIASILKKDISTIHYYVYPTREIRDRARYVRKTRQDVGANA